MKKIIVMLLVFILSVCANPRVCLAEDFEVDVEAQTAFVMEPETGTILYEKKADEKLPPASVTKIMTLLLIFDALDDGRITLDEEVSTSEYAASMGGSQVFLEAGEKQTVETLIKCIVVASGNDAAVAMAEKIGGTEEQFVEIMNQRAKELGMENTHFENCNGLDTEGHVTTARDIARMSQELIIKHPSVFDYTKIWMEDITHVTARGISEFGLTNTNKLIRQYEYATGLKTGSTSKAKFCLSATAEKDGIQMIAVVMGEPDSKTRTKDAIKLLNYGFGKCNLYVDDQILEEEIPVKVQKGKKEKLQGICEEEFRYLDFENSDFNQIEKKMELEELYAPVKAGDSVGTVRYYIGDSEIGCIPIVAKEGTEKKAFQDELLEVLEKAFTF